MQSPAIRRDTVPSVGASVPDASGPEPTWPEVYRLYREQIDHEDDLINQRLALLVASQSFLFSAYAVVLNGAAAPRHSLFAFQHRVLFWSIPFVATTLCWFISRSVRAAQLSMCHIRERWDMYRECARIPPCAPELQGEDATRKLGQLAPRLLPYILIGVWVVLYILCPLIYMIVSYAKFAY